MVVGYCPFCGGNKLSEERALGLYGCLNVQCRVVFALAYSRQKRKKKQEVGRKKKGGG